MSTIAPVAGPAPARPGIGTFERYLTLWVALCIVAGIGLGHLLPGLFARIASAEVARVNLIVAVLIWLMIVPMLLKIDFGALGSIRQHWKGVGVTLFINWAVKPFSMALLGTFFLGYLFRPWLPEAEIGSYIAGLILLAAAPCTAMVFVWSNLVDGEPNFTLSQVALNDAVMVLANGMVMDRATVVAALAARRFGPLDWLEERLADRRYLMGDTITEADVRLFTTLARFDAVYHGHFKCNRQKLTEMPNLWGYARDLYQTPGFGETIDFDQIKAHYYNVHRDVNPTGVIPKGPDLSGLLTPHHREELGGRPFGDGTAPGPVRPDERVDPAHTPLAV